MGLLNRISNRIRVWQQPTPMEQFIGGRVADYPCNRLSIELLVRTWRWRCESLGINPGPNSELIAAVRKAFPGARIVSGRSGKDAHLANTCLESDCDHDKADDPYAELIAETMNLLRSASHVDGLRLLADALERKLTEPDAPSLEFLFGFATSGPGFARKAIKVRRDRVLRDWRRITCPGLSVSAAALKAAEAMQRYERERWKPDRKAGHGPDSAAAPIEAIAFELLAEGKKVLSAETIRKALG